MLNRAIGHARGNGPHEPDERGSPLTPASPDTPILIYSGAKAITATVVHLLHERGLLDIADPGRRLHPRLWPARQGLDHDRATSSRTAPAVPNLAREAPWTSIARPTPTSSWRR